MAVRVMINGELKSESEARVSVFDRGFLYGDSVFETLRTYDGEPFALDEHLERLEWSAGRVYIDPPCERQTWAHEIHAVLQAANNAESMIRVMLTRGEAALGLDPTEATSPTRVILVAPLSPPRPEAYTDGVGVITFRTQRLADATDAAGAKIGNYLVAVLAMRQARQKGAVEALIIDASDAVVEGTSSNLFMVSAGALITPPASAGILPGITRGRILKVAESLGISVELRAPSLPELLAADEVFISSTIREMLPVTRIDDHALSNGKAGPITTRLLSEFRARFTRPS